MVIRITYTALVWWPRTKIWTSRAELSKLQRMACLVQQELCLIIWQLQLSAPGAPSCTCYDWDRGHCWNVHTELHWTM